MLNYNSALTIVIIFLTATFFISGIDKLSNLNQVSLGLQKRLSFSAPIIFFTIAILGAAILEIVAPSMMVYSSYTGKELKWASRCALALTAFTVLVTLIYHWPPNGKFYYPFIANVSTIGGLLLAAGVFGALDAVPDWAFNLFRLKQTI